MIHSRERKSGGLPLAGFTIIELLVVVSIIAILALIAVPNFQEAQLRSQVSAVKNNMRVVGMKLDVLVVDTNHYPLAGKWRGLILWAWDPDEFGDGPQNYLRRKLKVLYGPHQDLFDFLWMRNFRMVDAPWVVNDKGMHLFNGFSFFNPTLMREALESGCSWEDSARENWTAAEELAGAWMLISPGPDLILRSPAWAETPGQRVERKEDGYTEKDMFQEYDPTNGTLSYGNLFRTQRNAGGLGTHPRFHP